MLKKKGSTFLLTELTTFCNKSKLRAVSEAANWFTVDGIILHQTVFVQAAKYICPNCQTYLSKLSKVFDQITNFEPSERPCMRENWWFVIWSFWRNTFSYQFTTFWGLQAWLLIIRLDRRTQTFWSWIFWHFQKSGKLLSWMKTSKSHNIKLD